ncbi:MAG TPA: hypothetical protein VEM38_13190 [Burkholderiales bacterium]|nr:hypothetical protein [Burkholderiales bacterium]
MKKLITTLMVAAFAGTVLPSFAQTPTTPAPSVAPATPAAPMKSEHGKKHNKKHSKSKTEPKS